MHSLLHFVRQYFTVYMFANIFFVGIYETFIEPKFLEKKGLDKDSKLCKWIGMFYIFIGIAAIIFQIFFSI